MNKNLKLIFVVLAIFTLLSCFVGCNPHTHEFKEMVATETYLDATATCTQQATYFYSCSCGKKGTETFEYGETLQHEFNKQVVSQDFVATSATCNQKATYFYSCICGEKGTQTFESGDFSGHSFTRKQIEDKYLNTSATCNQKATYFYSCKCGEKGTQTFESGAIGNHNFVDNQPCSVCHASYGLKYEMAQDNSGYEVSIGDCTDKNIVIPMYHNNLLVTRIADNGFMRCTSITSVIIPSSVKVIGTNAFYKCQSLTSITIPSSVRTIGNFAFNACYSLVEVINKSHYFTIAKGGTDNGRVGEYALSVFNARDIVNSKLSNDNGFVVYNDGEEKILVGYNGTETNWTIPSYITKIKQYAFFQCESVVNIIMPSSVTTIEEYAFAHCSSLITVYYDGTETEWSSIYIGDNNTSLKNTTKYYYSQNEPTDDGNYWHYDTDGQTPVVWHNED